MSSAIDDADVVQPQPLHPPPPPPQTLAGKIDPPVEQEEIDLDQDFDKNPRPAVVGFTSKHAELYAEALDKYGTEGSIDPEAEKRLKRKIDCRILPLLGICYFFYCTS